MASRAAKRVSVDGGFSPGRGGWVKSVHESTNEGDSAYYDLFEDWRSGFRSGRSRELGAPIEPFLGIVLETVYLP